MKSFLVLVVLLTISIYIPTIQSKSSISQVKGFQNHKIVRKSSALSGLTISTRNGSSDPELNNRVAKMTR